MLTKVLDERPSDAVDIFEDISKESKRAQFVSSVDTVQDKIDRSNWIKTNFIDKGKMGLSSGEGFYKYPNPKYLDVDFLK